MLYVRYLVIVGKFAGAVAGRSRCSASHHPVTLRSAGHCTYGVHKYSLVAGLTNNQMVCKRKCCTAYATESVSDSPLSHAQLSGITTSHIDPREVGHKTVETVHKMRSLNDASASWQEFKRYQTIEELKEAVRLEGRTSAATRAGLRSACWKAFLLFENVATSSWLKTLGTTRSAYDSLSVHFLHNSNDQDGPPISIDPLSETTTVSACTPNTPICDLTAAKICQELELAGSTQGRRASCRD